MSIMMTVSIYDFVMTCFLKLEDNFFVKYYKKMIKYQLEGID